jgi:tRNA U55 pseudouridine synthase TruB
MSQSCNNIDGLLLLDKPFCITSFEAVHKRKVLNVEKTGHCDTF